PTIHSWHERVHWRGVEYNHRGVRQGPRLVKWRLVFTRQAQKDAEKSAAAGLRPKAEEFLDILEGNPGCVPPV
ncbi:MAG: hypothetical protein ACREX9_14700, partial [Gammaproteobacteria bacterium]